MSQTYNLIDSAPKEALAARRIALAHGNKPDALIEILHDLQAELGHVPEVALPALAKALNLSRAEVHGVISYYHHFRQAPPGRHVVQVCRAEACQACGAEELLVHAERVLGCASGTTRADGAVTLEPVYCLGLCASSPAMQVDGRLQGRATPAQLDALAASLGEPA